MRGAGRGIETRLDPATVAGFEIGDISGGAMALEMLPHPPSSAALSAAIPMRVWVIDRS
jgi:hypothetical protein